MFLMEKYSTKSSRTYKLQKQLNNRIQQRSSNKTQKYLPDIFALNSVFSFDLKLADVTQHLKKKSKTSKDNYKLISILPDICKLCERCSNFFKYLTLVTIGGIELRTSCILSSYLSSYLVG